MMKLFNNKTRGFIVVMLVVVVIALTTTTTSAEVNATSYSTGDTVPSGEWYFGDLALYEPKSNGGGGDSGCLSTTYQFVQLKSTGLAIVISVYGQPFVTIDTIVKRLNSSVLFEGIMTYKEKSAPICFMWKNGIDFSFTSTTDFLTCGSLGSNNEAPTCSNLDSHQMVFKTPGLITSLATAGIVVGLVMVVMCCLICCICCCVCIVRRRRNRKNARNLASMNETLLANQPLGSYVPNNNKPVNQSLVK